jgi:transcriptional regulator with GAF, ATPase, and Fis domain
MHDEEGSQDQASATGSTGADELAAQFSRLARGLRQQGDPDSTLLEIVRAAVQLIPGSEQGSVSTVIGRRHLKSQVTSGELARTLDELQQRTGQGPCLDAVYQHKTVLVSDLAAETRWPRFTQLACLAGAGSLLAFQLYVDGDNLGALNLYAGSAGAFDDESEHIGRLFASHAALAYDAAQTQSGLTRSVATRQLIGQAQGILMERHKVTADQAFAMLVQVSQHSNTKLRDIAEQLVHSGMLPTDQQ